MFFLLPRREPEKCLPKGDRCFSDKTFHKNIIIIIFNLYGNIVAACQD